MKNTQSQHFGKIAAIDKNHGLHDILQTLVDDICV